MLTIDKINSSSYGCNAMKKKTASRTNKRNLDNLPSLQDTPYGKATHCRLVTILSICEIIQLLYQTYEILFSKTSIPCSQTMMRNRTYREKQNKNW
jgi:hypothetical protein